MADHDDAKKELEAWQLIHKDELEQFHIHKVQIVSKFQSALLEGKFLWKQM